MTMVVVIKVKIFAMIVEVVVNDSNNDNCNGHVDGNGGDAYHGSDFSFSLIFIFFCRHCVYSFHNGLLMSCTRYRQPTH